MSNTFGRRFRLTTFGESHGAAVGGIIDGCPAGVILNIDQIQYQLDRRKPGQSHLTTQRKETDQITILSGIFENQTTGAPICFMVQNQDAKPADYAHLKDTFRPSHADYTYYKKYSVRDYRGGGRASARETVARVAAGEIARQWLSTQYEIRILAWVSAIYDIKMPDDYTFFNAADIEANPVRCPHAATAEKMAARILEARKNGDTLGGIINVQITGVPAGWGEPVFDKLHARLAYAMLGINACKGFEYGSGFNGTTMKGSEHNDIFTLKNQQITTLTNFSGGIQGGISNGEAIYFRLAFKPVATLLRDQPGITVSGENTIVKGRGRHDPCVLPRAVPIVEAMAWLVLADAALLALT
jgi:chorismate synthase